MKRIALTAATAAALAVTGPAFAQSQMERELGVAPGVFTTSQLVELKGAAEQTGNDARVHFDANEFDMRASTAGIVNPRARHIVRDLLADSDDGLDRLNARFFDTNDADAAPVNARATAEARSLIRAGDE